MNCLSTMLFTSNYARFGYNSAFYMILNTLTGSFYVGSTTNAAVRISKHASSLKNNEHTNIYLQREYNELWTPSSVFGIIVTFTTSIDEATVLEQMCLNERYTEPGCLNVNGIAHGRSRSGSSFVSSSVLDSEKYERHRRVVSASVVTYSKSAEAKITKSTNSKRMWENDDYRDKWLCKNGDQVTVDGIKYRSVREASRCTGVSILSIRSRMGPDKTVSLVDLKKPTRRVSVKGVIYESLRSASVALGVAENTMTWRCQNKSDSWKDHYYLE